ncbi:MAG TPA: hypothetical protein VGV92_00730 [Gammaproteobacteria bacterium]|nr:hypothetical protein [Gammaproteobacteria bacterium]
MSRYLLRLFFYLFIAVSLSACATLYQPASSTGFGYSETQIDHNTIRVNFNGNGDTTKSTVENYALYRCAETTLNHGYDYFVIVSNNIDARDQSVVVPPTYAISPYSGFPVYPYGYGFGPAGFYPYGPYSSPPEVYNYRQYGSSVTIKMFKGKKPAKLLNAYDAQEVVEYMSGSIKRAR